jgi:hypothetical protein
MVVFIDEVMFSRMKLICIQVDHVVKSLFQ